MPKECTIPDFGASTTDKFPENCGGILDSWWEEHKTLFGIISGKISHYIPTKGPPICVPP